ncbi:MAG: RNA polymerase sigma factor [Thermoanaerobaculia bacterium]
MTTGASALAPAPGDSDEDVLRTVLPSARTIVRHGFRIPAQDVDDVLQQACVDFLVQSRRGARAAGGLMVVITRRRCLDYWRSRYRPGAKEVAIDELHEEDRAYPVECAPEPESVAAGMKLARTWPSLSEGCRQVLASRFWRDRRTADLAATMGYKADSVKRMISRCLGKLRRSMGEAT